MTTEPEEEKEEDPKEQSAFARERTKGTFKWGNNPHEDRTSGHG